MLFTHKNASLSPAAQAFLDLVNALFKGRPRSGVRAPLKQENQPPRPLRRVTRTAV
jgi:hypothetical protein